MSLKSFHLLFITLSTLLAIGFGIWELKGYIASSDAMHLAAGVGSFVIALALVVYGIRFMRKYLMLGEKNQ